MRYRFDPEAYPDQVIVIDLNAGTQKINCLACGQLVEQVWKNNELCLACYDEWSKGFAREWVRWKSGEAEEIGRIPMPRRRA